MQNGLISISATKLDQNVSTMYVEKYRSPDSPFDA